MRPLKQAVYSSRTADKFVVRLPDGMREKIAERARIHHRSMNSQIISVLEKDLAIELTDDERALLELESHTNPDVKTPLQVGMAAYYDYLNDGKLAVGVVTGIAISMDDDVFVTFDIVKNAPTLIIGSRADDKRKWFPVAQVKPYLI
ncbi:Arc-like transcriptional regulator [Pseudomonas phage Noxifer]|uniref:Putative DNA-binding protein n=1 Tax=Pseudomonas phage Noxifer TaxID=2006684 RepID=A0A1Y0SXL4_9CAUD|nr:Arc-like transcriptional regulator [Pseudomonas phage Noxifer]ARV77275.1 putative DNA-binding protein [Pseudomonas phage Noxifer]